MKKSRAFALSLILILTAATVGLSQTAGKRVALVIGNGAYAAKPLRNPPNDANDMAAALRKAGFEVELAIDAGLDQMYTLIDNLSLRAKGAEVALFYYAGHGIQFEGRNYFIPSGVSIDQPSHLRSRAVEAEYVLSQMEASGASMKLLILDACRDNPFPGVTRSMTRGLADMKAPGGALILFATSPGDVAADGSGRNGLFTEALLGRILTPGISILDMMTLVTIDTKARSGGSQRPYFQGSLERQFSMVPGDSGDHGVVLKGAITVSSLQAGELWLDGKRYDSIRAKGGTALTDLAIGEYRLEMRYADGSVEYETVVVRAGVTSQVSFTYVAIPKGMVFIPAGTFTMGSPPSEPEREPWEKGSEMQHQVTLSAFFMGKYEVTQAEWKAIMGSNPSAFKGDSLPVEMVSWLDVVQYCNKRSLKEGLIPVYTISGEGVSANWAANGYRLPTEAEWEYACRAGTGTPFSYGSSLSSSQANFDGKNPYGGAAKGPYLQKTSVVGSYAPNAWGLYDMHGNVWEWCWDWYWAYSGLAQTNPRGAAKQAGVPHVFRGGSWNSSGEALRSAHRYDGGPDYRYGEVGFRLVRLP